MHLDLKPVTELCKKERDALRALTTRSLSSRGPHQKSWPVPPIGSLNVECPGVGSGEPPLGRVRTMCGGGNPAQS